MILMYYKQHTGQAGVSYNESVEEALCFGWVDSLVRRLDEDRFARKFTPRKADSNWSASNRKRIRKLSKEGRMTEHGMALVEAAKKTRRWKSHERPAVSTDMPGELTAGLRRDVRAEDFFESLTPRQQLQFVVWINVAKRPDTRALRVAESLRLLKKGEKLGMR